MSKQSLLKIVSGGQTGVDRAALDAAMTLSLPCGGWCPKGRKSEQGTIPSNYPLQETASADYRQRTEWNVRDSDGTLIIVNAPPSGGTQLTIDMAQQQQKPYYIVQLNRELSEQQITFYHWLNQHKIAILNIAGPRASQDITIYQQSHQLLTHWLATINKT